MITFITSVRHPHNSNNYNNCWKILNKTLHSISSQNNKDYRIIVVANKILDRFNNTNIVYIQTDLVPGAQIKQSHAHIQRSCIRTDKGSKYLIGLNEANNDKNDFIMFVDADDFVRNDTIDVINEMSPQNGVVIRRGLIKMEDRYIHDRNINNVCGSTFVYRKQLLKDIFNTRNNMQSYEQHADVIGINDDYLVQHLLGSHQIHVNFFKEQNTPFDECHKPLIMYNKGTGENWALTRHIHDSFKNKQHLWKVLSQDIIHQYNIT